MCPFLEISDHFEEETGLYLYAHMPYLVFLEDSTGFIHLRCEISCSTFYSGALHFFCCYGEFQTCMKVERILK